MAEGWEDDEFEDDEPADEEADDPDGPDSDLRRDTDSVDTLECPHCGRDVYEHAQRCPLCGRYISQEDAPHRYRGWIIAGALAALAAAVVWVARCH